MASSSGNSNSNSSGSYLHHQINSGSEQDLIMMDQRIRKRKESNRESARRSRMRKQKQLNELVGQISELKKLNDQVMTSINFTTHHYLNVEAENSVLRAQMMELSHRLDSLNEILGYLNHPNQEAEGIYFSPDCFTNPFFDLAYLNQQQPIMASADIFQC